MRLSTQSSAKVWSILTAQTFFSAKIQGTSTPSLWGRAHKYLNSWSKPSGANQSTIFPSSRPLSDLIGAPDYRAQHTFLNREPEGAGSKSWKAGIYETMRRKTSKFSFARKGREKGLPSWHFSSGKPLCDRVLYFYRNTADEHSAPLQFGVFPESWCKRSCNRMKLKSSNVNTLVTVPVCHYCYFDFILWCSYVLKESYINPHASHHQYLMPLWAWKQGDKPLLIGQRSQTMSQ